MASVARTAGAAGSITLTTRNTAGQLIVPVSVPVVRWYTDPARTLGELTLPVTGSGSTYTATWTAAQAPTAVAPRYLTVTIEVSAGVFDTDSDDDISFVDAATSIDNHYFTVAEARATDATFASLSDQQIIDARAEVEDEIEALCGVAFVPRTATATLNGYGRRSLLLPHVHVRSVTAVRVWTDAVTFTDYTAAELADIVPSDTGVIWRSSLGYWPAGFENIRVTYTHGMDAPPPRVKRATLILFRYRLLESLGSPLEAVRSETIGSYSVSYDESESFDIQDVVLKITGFGRVPVVA